MERQEPLHRLGRRGPHREGARGGHPRGRAAGGGGHPARRAAHLGAAPGDRHRTARPRRVRPALGPGQAVLAPQRAPLRSPAGQGQEGHPRGVRRGAVHALAPLLRHPAAADRRRRPVGADRRAALRRPARRDPAAHGVPRRRRPADAPLLVRRDRARPARRADGLRRGPRQLAARAGQAPRRHERGGRGRAEHPHRHPAGVPPRRGHAPARARRSVPGPRRRRRGDQGGREPGPLCRLRTTAGRSCPGPRDGSARSLPCRRARW